MLTHPSHPIIQVALPLPLRRTFDYLPKPDMPAALLQPGCRVKVPFGKRQMIGIIHAISHQSDMHPSQLKTIVALPDPEIAIPGNLMKLCQWASDYYQHGIGDVYSHTLPTILRKQDSTWLEAHEYWCLTQKGRLTGLDPLRRAHRQLQAVELLREHPKGLHQPVLKGLGVERSTLNALQKKGLVEAILEQPRQSHWRREAVLAESALTLNPEQQHALDQIQLAEDFSPFLLEGVTGSGKTEVYLQAIAHCLKKGKQALVLVPEIGLTPQTLHRFQQRFAVPIVALHSNLTERERLISWRKARAAEAAVVLGTRSALFTPFEQLGLIIIDEEHDLSYKQQEGFRYHARDLAIIRAKQEDIPIILGSATPALETLYNARSGRYQHLLLAKRAGQAQAPQFRVMDIRQKALTHGLCPELLTDIKQRLKDRQQVLMFINRRGYAPVLMCHDCGWFKECPHCDHRMTCHANPAHLHCHHCNYQRSIPKTCEHCKSTDLRPVGMGTERLEDNLKSLFPETPIIRIDRDSTQRKHALSRQLDRVNSGEPCILVGTQMLAKGHHFPKVTLVAICDIDSGLFAADFRATEHTAQLMIQVAGRAGRGDDKGLVFLQTHQPSHPLFQTLINQSYSHYATELLQERGLMGMPPHGFLTLIRAESADPKQASDFLNQVSLTIQTLAEQHQIEIWGPAPALMARKAGRYRFQLMLRGSRRPQLQQMLRNAIQKIDQLAGHRIKWSVDVDPVTLD